MPIKIFNSRKILCGLVALLGSTSTYADSGDSILSRKLVPETKLLAIEEPLNRFQQDGPSSVLFQQATEDDESAMEIEYSFKYIVYNCEYTYDYTNDVRKPNCDSTERWRDEYYLSFTGEFDFYVKVPWGGRKSSPVINRVSNPSLHWRMKPLKNLSSLKNFTFEWIDFGIEHRSNGQVIEIDERDTDPASPTVGQLRTRIAQDNEDYAYFDGLSRGSNYVKIAASLRRGVGSEDERQCGHTGYCATYWASVKIYFSHDTDVNWGRYANEDVSILDYDIVRLGFTNRFHTIFHMFPTMNVSAEYTFGRDFFDKDSLDVGLTLPVEAFNGFKWPWYVKMHFGPMNNLSNYTKSENSIGIGVLFTM